MRHFQPAKKVVLPANGVGTPRLLSPRPTARAVEFAHAANAFDMVNPFRRTSTISALAYRRASALAGMDSRGDLLSGTEGRLSKAAHQQTVTQTAAGSPARTRP